jgi:hypothetical protein
MSLTDYLASWMVVIIFAIWGVRLLVLLWQRTR